MVPSRNENYSKRINNDSINDKKNNNNNYYYVGSSRRDEVSGSESGMQGEGMVLITDALGMYVCMNVCMCVCMYVYI